jgi:alkylation response protein AidB-like acyl-CoA dehydrogenase
MTGLMETAYTDRETAAALRTLPGDDVRQIMWRFADRYDLQMVVQSVRSVARGPVAQLVAGGARNTHEWTAEKAELLAAFDQAGITSLFMEPEYGGFIEGPKNLALALAAFELAWVDAGAATCSLAGHLALSPIHERGTEEQRQTYMSRCVPTQPGEDRQSSRGAFCLTEPLPYVGVDTGVVSGKVRVAEWKEGEEPLLKVDKRGRFITNMGFADFVSAAVDSDDERIKGSCMIIVEQSDPGVFDRGIPTRKMVHQLSSTRDPIFSVTVPASRIIGGYTVQDGRIVPNYSHGEVIEAVFRRTRVTVGVMTAAKLLSAVEPIIRYQRTRFRGGQAGGPGSPRHDLGLQQKEDALHRLVDVWATGEASASLGFAAARLFDEFDPIERAKEEYFAGQGVVGGRAQLRAFRKVQGAALEYVRLAARPEGERDEARLAELGSEVLVKFSVLDSLANVLCPAAKLWNTGHGANVMREAVSLMGGYGITEDCPGFLGHKWMDAQLEATYEGPESVQRRQLSVTMTNEVFLAHFEEWLAQMKDIAERRPESGACALVTGMELWLWTLRYLLEAKDVEGKPLYRDQRQGVTFSLADALCWLLASRHQILDVLALEEKGPENPLLAEGLPGLVGFFLDLCQVQAARASGEVARICAELVFGYGAAPAGDAEEGASETEAFVKLRARLDRWLGGTRLAKDRAARSLVSVMIPEALDYPA